MSNASDASHHPTTDLDALRAELDAVKRRLADVEKVVKVYEEDGETYSSVECNCVVVRPEEDPRWISIQIDGRLEGGPFISFYHGKGDELCFPLELRVEEDGTPRVQLNGLDRKSRGEFFIDKDHGTLAVLGPGNRPGAVLRAQPGGGSVAVLQPDGKARGVLIHKEAPTESGEVGASATELIFATGEGKTLAKIHAAAAGVFLSMGQPGQPPSAMLAAQPLASSLTLHSPSRSHSVDCAAMDMMARVATQIKSASDARSEAALSSCEEGGSLALRDPENVERVDVSATLGSAVVALRGREATDPAVVLSHHEGSHSSLALAGVAGHDCLRFLANKDVSVLRLTSPVDGQTQITHAIDGRQPTVMVERDGKTQAAMGTTENGGYVSAYGAEKEKTGFASLSGGGIGGGVSLRTADGTPQLILDATDHGGRMHINNDIGFQRIGLGTYKESAGLLLNHTGSTGVSVSALPGGGLITVCDSEGNPIQTIPEDFKEGDRE